MTPHEKEIAILNNPQELRAWLLSQLPASVVGSDPEITIDADELLIILTLNAETLVGEGEALKNAEQALIERQRSETRRLRIQLGRQLERTCGYAVSWGMRAGGTVQLFTPNTTAVMTRLSREERQVLDTLIAANVANTRSAALGYIVRTFAAEHQEWLIKAQQAAKNMASLRAQLHPEPRGDPSSLDSSAHDSEISF
ncbi:MAG: hypothetical protein NVS4B11_05890 [Ktedonobacteraceae bacterium]